MINNERINVAPPVKNPAKFLFCATRNMLVRSRCKSLSEQIPFKVVGSLSRSKARVVMLSPPHPSLKIPIVTGEKKTCYCDVTVTYDDTPMLLAASKALACSVNPSLFNGTTQT